MHWSRQICSCCVVMRCGIECVCLLTFGRSLWLHVYASGFRHSKWLTWNDLLLHSYIVRGVARIWYLCVGVVLCKCILIVQKNLLIYHVVFLSLIISSCQWADWYHVGFLSIIYVLSAQIFIHIDIYRKSRKWWWLEDAQTLGFQNLMWHCPALSCFVLLCPALSWQGGSGLSVSRSVCLAVSWSLGLSASRSLGLSVSLSLGLSVFRFLGLSVWREFHMYHIKRELYGSDFLWPGLALGILVGQSFVGRPGWPGV